MCGVCCTAHSDGSAQRRKWRVLVPILHFWNSLGKEAPLHLLLFVVADIISFPDQSVRVSCHSVKILLCYWEGFVGGKEGGREEEGKKEWEKEGEGRGRCVSIKAICLWMREPGRRMIFSICPEEILLYSGSNHFAFICLLMPNSKWTEVCHNEVPVFSKQPDFIFLLFRLAKRKKKSEDCNSIECNYSRTFLFLFLF